MRRWMPVVVAALACRGNPEARDVSADSTSDSAAALSVADTSPPVMPDLPGGRRGHMVAVSAGERLFQAQWPARGGRCARPPMLLLLGEDPGKSGGSVLLQLPESGSPVTEYPVRLADSAGPPPAPAAQLGFQFFDKDGADAYQGAEGAVRVTALDDRRVSGSFQVTVRHISSDARVLIAGTFDNVDVEPLAPDWCERAKSAQDSLRVAGS